MAETEPQRYGNFVLQERIAMGGMAEIFRAKKLGAEGFEKELVVKRILPHFSEDEAFVTMFKDEARIAANLNHANIVQIYEFDEFEGTFYIAMEYIDGPSVGVLTRRARQSKIPVPPLIAAEIVAQSCDGLHAAHELRDEAGVPLGLVHRDISPHNLMLTRNGMVKLLDFGVAKLTSEDDLTATSGTVGTIAYMSPEQLDDGRVDRRADV